MLIDKILKSKLTKSERQLNGSVVSAAMLLAASIPPLLLYLLYSMMPVGIEKLLSVMLIFGVTLVCCFLIFVYYYTKVKSSINKDMKN